MNQPEPNPPAAAPAPAAPPAPAPSLAREDDPARWRRRARTISAVLLATIAATALAPLLLLLAALVDAWRDRRWPLVRAVAFFVAFLWAETLGVALAFALWVRYAPTGPRGRGAFLRGNARLQDAWGTTLFRVGRRLLGYRERIEGADALAAPGPVVMLVRHASTVDTVLPVVVLAAHGRAYRYVLKAELLVDPCLDIVGHRLPNVFVARDAGRTEEGAARVVALAQGMGDEDATVMFPEGTRFTPAKRERLLARLEARGDAEALALARELTATLPPLRRGSVALLAGTPEADVVVLAHTGLEPAGAMRDFLRGGLIGAEVRVKLWRHRAADVPRDEAGVRRFLAQTWREVDAFVRGA